MLSKVRGVLFLLLVCTVGACAHYRPNDRLARYDDKGGYRFSSFEADPSNSDSLFVCLAFSGGGTRAAALSYGVLKKLADIKITWEGRQKSLLEEVDCISSVSGGSFTAAYYALFRERLFQDFATKFLYRDIQGELISLVWNPVNWTRLLSPYFSRIDLAEELYDATIFEGKTFGELGASRRRPFLILNATNLMLGDRFEFSQEQFDVLGSDLTTYPIARAVAASSAFPFLLNPVSLINHPQPANYTRPSSLTNGLKAFDTNRRRYEWANNQVAYEDKKNHPFVHLMDGGLADNIGLRSVADSYRRGYIRELINGEKIKRLVIIVVNARTEPPEEIDQHESPPNLLTVGYKVATTSMDNYSFETIEMMKDLRDARVKAQRAVSDCQSRLLKHCPAAPALTPLAGEIDPTIVEINFEALRDDPDRRNYFLSLPTSFKLSSKQVDDLIAVGQELLEKSPEFQSFLNRLESPR